MIENFTTYAVPDDYRRKVYVFRGLNQDCCVRYSSVVMNSTWSGDNPCKMCRVSASRIGFRPEVASVSQMSLQPRSMPSKKVDRTQHSETTPVRMMRSAFRAA